MGLFDAFMGNADEASKFSQQTFPGQGWDNSQRNALRHSMLIGGMAKQLGARPGRPYWNPFAQAIAKGVGYAHEGVSALDDMRTGRNSGKEHSRDTLHDLNANAVGAEVAASVPDVATMRRILANMAVTGRRGAPVGLLSMSDGQLSYDPNTGEQVQPTLLSRGR